MEDRTRLSRWLYSVLESVGASERLRRLHHQTAATREILQTIKESFANGTVFNKFICGSSYEGSVTPTLASDIDIVMCTNYPPVVLDAAASPLGASLLMVRDSWTYPGYVKLQGVWDGQPWHGYHMLTHDMCNDNVGRVTLKHINLGNMHGPANMHIDHNGVHLQDFVPALRCNDIPQHALEWITRPRPNEWPSRNQLQIMSGMGCMVVGTGHVNSGERKIEWRMSYTLQERILMSSLNPVQHKVYILLKMLKKDVLRNIFHDDTLTSYHFKTCVMYAVQMSTPRVWTQNNLINCLLGCLKLMFKWLKFNNCPSFWTKHQNLFVKEGFSRNRIGLLKKMHELIESGHQFLYMIQCDNVGAILRNGDWRMYREVTTDKKNIYKFKLKLTCLNYIIIDAIKIVRLMSNGNYDPFTLTLVLKNLKNVRYINNHAVEVIQSVVTYLFPWLHLHIANGLASLTVTSPNRAVRERVMKLVDFHFNEARAIDLVNERLAVATVLYTYRKYKECSLLLHLIEGDFTYKVVQWCPCTASFSLPYNGAINKQEYIKKMAHTSIRQNIKSMTAWCVIFLPSAADLAPEPLQYEMQRSLGTLPGSRDEKKDFWFDWAVVDAKVYLYFMQYLVNSKLHKEVHRQVARDNIRAEIVEDDQRMTAGRESWLHHRDTTYNLLGWIYMQEEQMVEAYKCFQASWKIRPFHNAAKYHMRDLVVWLAERRVQH